SDLFRRVTMLLEAPQRVEKGCPRWWSLAAAGGLLALAVLASGVGVTAAAPPDDDEKVIVVTPGKDGARGETRKRVIVATDDDVKVVPGKQGKKHVIVATPDKITGEVKVQVVTPDGVKPADAKAIKKYVLSVVDDDDEKPAKKKREGEKKAEGTGFKIDVDAILKNLPENIDKDQLRREINKAMEQVRKAVEEAKREAQKAAAESGPEARKAAAEALKALSKQQ